MEGCVRVPLRLECWNTLDALWLKWFLRSGPSSGKLSGVLRDKWSVVFSGEWSGVWNAVWNGK